MATTTSHGLSVPVPALAKSVTRPPRRRHISLRAARGLRLLSHAIEYLGNEFIHDSAPPSRKSDRIRAMKLLMSLKGEVYVACPEEPTAAERWHWFLRPAKAK